jgi:predicted DNA-binding transcriptional regulator YafY
MRRADRLFDIIQMLRRRKLTTARQLAEALEVSERTIYRDIRDLIVSGVPIDGEAGVGYLLRRGFDLPPLMFTPTEIEALVLGARIVAASGDPELAAAAEDALVKVEAVLPERLRDVAEATALYPPIGRSPPTIGLDLAELRSALRRHRKLRFAYVNAQGEGTRRTVRPLCLLYYGPIWLLVAWCELRTDFRSFRLDRIAEPEVLEEGFALEPGKRLADYLLTVGYND